MRHIASEGRCWVIGSGCALHPRDIPRSFPSVDTVFPDGDEWLNPGDSVIVAPTGRVVAGPLHEAYDILYADIDATEATSQHRTARRRRPLQPTGHLHPHRRSLAA